MNLMEKYQARLNDASRGGEPEPLPSEKPVEPSGDKSVEQEKRDQPETAGPRPLFSGSIDGDLPVVPAEGRVQKAKMAPVKIFSSLFNEEIWLVADQEEMEILVSKGVKEVVYMMGEIPLLKEMNRGKLMIIHSVKKIFPGAGLVC
jgi:hypothetical protein